MDPKTENLRLCSTTRGGPVSWAIADTLATLRRELAASRDVEAAIAATWHEMASAAYLTIEDLAAWGLQ